MQVVLKVVHEGFFPQLPLTGIGIFLQKSEFIVGHVVASQFLLHHLSDHILFGGATPRCNGQVDGSPFNPESSEHKNSRFLRGTGVLSEVPGFSAQSHSEKHPKDRKAHTEPFHRFFSFSEDSGVPRWAPVGEFTVGDSQFLHHRKAIGTALFTYPATRAG